MDTEPSYPLAEYDSGRLSTVLGRGFESAYAAAGWVLFFGNAAVIVWLWWHNGGVSGIRDTTTLLISLGRITGLLGAYLLLIQLLFFARLPWFVRHVGLERLVIWHRVNGKACIILILGHVALITVGYASFSGVSVASEFSTLLNQYSGMIRATIGTILLVLVLATSLLIVRRGLRYELWYVVHLTAYLAVLLAWYHQIPNGNEFVIDTNAAHYWTALYLVTLVLILAFRVTRPLIRAWRYQLKVAEAVSEGPNVVSFRLTGRNLNQLNARAGQFFILRFMTWKLVWQSHPFSLSAAPDGHSLRFTIKIAGDFTKLISELPPGTRVLAEGPLGLFTDVVRTRPGVALIAGGIGVTPMRALLEDMTGDLVLIYRVAREDEVLFREELQEIAQRRSARLHFVTGDHRESGNEHLMSTEHLCSLVPDLSERDIYLCGPPRMMDAIEANVRAAGVSRKYIHTERFAF